MPTGSLPVVAWQSPKARRLVAFTAVLGSMLLGSRIFADRLLRLLMYHPSLYEDDPSHLNQLRDFQQLFQKLGYLLEFVDYDISAISGRKDSASRWRQRAFLVQPQEAPVGLWIVFGGNAMLAIDWIMFLYQLISRQAPGTKPAFLLVDYPGYGSNQGTPSPDSILSTSLAALDKALPKLAGPPGQLHLLGHSLGSAAAVQLAATLPRNEEKTNELSPGILLLSAPFTSTIRIAQAMANQLFYGIVPPTWLLRFLVTHRWDTQLLLPRAAARGWQTKIIHGIHDEIVPFSMGRQLHEDLQRKDLKCKSEFVEAQSGHNDVLGKHFNDYAALMDVAAVPGSSL